VVSIYLISGVPQETEEDIQATVDLIREILPHDGIVAPLAIYPGTRLYEDSKRFLGVGDEMWVTDPRAAVYVREDEVAQRHFRMLTTELQRTGRRAAYGPADFDRFDREQGFCFTTAMQRSEYHRARGEMDRALTAAEEIVRREPGNPWGPLRLAELHAETGATGEASAMRARAKQLVPRLVA